MAKEQGITVEGNVIKAYPNAQFDVKLDNEHVARCHVCGQMRKNFIGILPGDRVQVELSPYDLKRGIINYRNK